MRLDTRSSWIVGIAAAAIALVAVWSLWQRAGSKTLTPPRQSPAEAWSHIGVPSNPADEAEAMALGQSVTEPFIQKLLQEGVPELRAQSIAQSCANVIPVLLGHGLEAYLDAALLQGSTLNVGMMESRTSAFSKGAAYKKYDQATLERWRTGTPQERYAIMLQSLAPLGAQVKEIYADRAEIVLDLLNREMQDGEACNSMGTSVHTWSPGWESEAITVKVPVILSDDRPGTLWLTCSPVSPSDRSWNVGMVSLCAIGTGAVRIPGA